MEQSVPNNVAVALIKSVQRMKFVEENFICVKRTSEHVTESYEGFRDPCCHGDELCVFRCVRNVPFLTSNVILTSEPCNFLRPGYILRIILYHGDLAILISVQLYLTHETLKIPTTGIVWFWLEWWTLFEHVSAAAALLLQISPSFIYGDYKQPTSQNVLWLYIKPEIFIVSSYSMAQEPELFYLWKQLLNMTYFTAYLDQILISIVHFKQHADGFNLIVHLF